MNVLAPNFRIITSDNRIKYAGSCLPSWMDLDKARSLVNYSAGEMIYYYENGERMYEVF